MTMARTFAYDESDFVNGSADPSRLMREVQTGLPFGRAAKQIKLVPKRPGPGFDLEITFSRDLIASEETALDALIAVHDPSKAPAFLPGRSIAELAAKQPGVSVGTTAWANDARKVGEGPGAGTGVPVYSDGTIWRTYADIAPQA